jgi:hypothetical protein
VVDEACAQQTDWPRGVAPAIAAALDLSVSNPSAMRELTVDVFDHGLPGALRYRRAVEDFASLLTEGRGQGAESDGLPPVLEEALIWAVASPIAEAVRMGRETSLPALAPELTEFVLTPYLGAAEAKRIGALA